MTNVTLAGRRLRQVLFTVAAVAGPLLRAQSVVGLETQYRLFSTSAPSEIRYDSGFINAPGPLVHSDSDSGSVSGSFSSSSITVSTGYGNMSISGNATVTNSESQGAFAGADNGGGPIAMYRDVLHVTSSTLAAGTPVDIGFTETFTATSSSVDPYNFGPPSFTDFLWIQDIYGQQWQPTLAATGSASDLFQARVGDTISLLGQLHVSATAWAGFTGNTTASYSFSISGPLTISSVTPGADIHSESGATYSPSSVPESASTLALLGMAIFILAAMRTASPRKAALTGRT